MELIAPKIDILILAEGLSGKESINKILTLGRDS